MKYVVLKNSRNVLCVQLPEGFGSKLEIVCIENQAEFNDFLKENPTALCQMSFPLSVQEMEKEESNSGKDGLFIRQNEYFKKVLFEDMMWIEASRSYCYIHTTDRAKIIITFPMSEVKKKLPEELFIQTHRSYILNKKFVNKFIGNMIYIDNQSFPISRKFKQKVLEQFLFLDNLKATSGSEDNPLGSKKPPVEKEIDGLNEDNVDV